jgi:hypothetical protein
MRIGIDCDGVLRDFIPDSKQLTHNTQIKSLFQNLGIGKLGCLSGQKMKQRNMFSKIII